MPTVIDHEGQICIQTEWERMATQPKRLRHTYPTGLKTRDWDGFVGLEVRCSGCVGDGLYIHDSGIHGKIRLRLVNAGQTLPILIEEDDLKPPRGGPWIFSWGEWVNQRTGKRRIA